MQARVLQHLEKLQQRDQLTPEGKSWLISALDPFHDTEFKTSGYPDVDTSRTVTMCFQQSKTISKPSAIPNGNWDCHITANPDMLYAAGPTSTDDIGLYFTSDIGGPNYQQLIASYSGLSETIYQYPPFAPLLIGCQPSGIDTFPTASTYYTGLNPPASTVRWDSMSYNNLISGGLCRVIGIGFEVVNTTAELNKQGSVCVYRMPNTTVSSNVRFLAPEDSGVKKVFDKLSLDQVPSYEFKPSDILQTHANDPFIPAEFKNKVFSKQETTAFNLAPGYEWATKNQVHYFVSKIREVPKKKKIEKLAGASVGYHDQQRVTALKGYYGDDRIFVDWTELDATNVQISCSPPGSFGEAVLLQGSKVWDAREGCYVVCGLSTQANPLTGRIGSSRLFRNLSMNGTGAEGYVLTNPLAQVGPAQMTLPTPYNQSGAYFIGLSNVTTLELTYKVYVEMCPDVADQQLITLARPSPSYDPIALQAYSQICAQMPPGCMFKDNPRGEWWRSIGNIVLDAMPAIAGGLSAINPALGAAAGAVTPALRAALIRQPKNKPQSQPQSNNNPNVRVESARQKQKQILPPLPPRTSSRKKKN